MDKSLELTYTLAASLVSMVCLQSMVNCDNANFRKQEIRLQTIKIKCTYWKNLTSDFKKKYILQVLQYYGNTKLILIHHTTEVVYPFKNPLLMQKIKIKIKPESTHV